MPISINMLGPSLAVASALALGAAPASAQLLGGGLGGAVSLPGTMIGGAGDFGVSRVGREVSTAGNIEATRRVRQPAVPQRVAEGALSSRVTAPAAPLAEATASVRAAVPTAARAITSSVAGAAGAARIGTAVPVPTLPDLAVRRTAIIEAGIAPVVLDEVPAYVERQYLVLQDELRGTGVNVRKQGQQIVLDLPSDVNFAFDKSDIQPRFYHTLNAVSRVLARYPSTYVDVNGHTDAVGSYGYNQALSERRADAVADFLADRSVNPVRMHVAGFGKTEPIASNATVSGRAANRRVEIILTPVEA
jgi:outer membrane protein OmpA-like peptidoglycan-associated protein